jgi:hypothetical protein
MQVWNVQAEIACAVIESQIVNFNHRSIHAELINDERTEGTFVELCGAALKQAGLKSSFTPRDTTP